LSAVRIPLSITRAALLVEGSDRQFRAFIQSLFSVAGQLEALREKIGALADISGGQYGILMAILHNEGDRGVAVARLAERLHLRANFVTTEVNKLHAVGLVKKRGNPDDGRSVLITLSSKGRTLLHSLLPTVEQINNEIFRDTSRAQFQTMQRVLAELADSLGDAHALMDRIARRAQRGNPAR